MTKIIHCLPVVYYPVNLCFPGHIVLKTRRLLPYKKSLNEFPD